MTELKETPAFARVHLPVTGADYKISALPATRITSLAPWPGQTNALRAELGGFPEPGKVISVGNLRLAWAGRDTAFAFGPDMPGGLEKYCAITDQSDAWAGLELFGEGGEAFLARLLPFDLRRLPTPGVARSLLGHVPVLVVRLEPGRFEIWLWRSMTASLPHELSVPAASNCLTSAPMGQIGPIA